MAGGKDSLDLGEVTRVGNTLTITMNKKACRMYIVAIDVLLHEYAHCRLWGLASTEESEKIDNHGPDFWAEYGVLYNMFHYDGGHDHSKEF